MADKKEDGEGCVAGIIFLVVFGYIFYGFMGDINSSKKQIRLLEERVRILEEKTK